MKSQGILFQTKSGHPVKNQINKSNKISMSKKKLVFEITIET